MGLRDKPVSTDRKLGLAMIRAVKVSKEQRNKKVNCAVVVAHHMHGGFTVLTADEVRPDTRAVAVVTATERD